MNKNVIIADIRPLRLYSNLEEIPIPSKSDLDLSKSSLNVNIFSSELSNAKFGRVSARVRRDESRKIAPTR